jgi:hypothetical protein
MIACAIAGAMNTLAIADRRFSAHDEPIAFADLFALVGHPKEFFVSCYRDLTTEQRDDTAACSRSFTLLQEFADKAAPQVNFIERDDHQAFCLILTRIVSKTKGWIYEPSRCN